MAASAGRVAQPFRLALRDLTGRNHIAAVRARVVFCAGLRNPDHFVGILRRAAFGGRAA